MHESGRVSCHPGRHRFSSALAALAVVVAATAFAAPAFATVPAAPGKGNGNGPPPGKGPPPGVRPPGLAQPDGRADREPPGKSEGTVGEASDVMVTEVDTDGSVSAPPAVSPASKPPVRGSLLVAALGTAGAAASDGAPPSESETAAPPAPGDEAIPSVADLGATAGPEPAPTGIGVVPMPFSSEPHGVGAWLVAVIMGGVALGYAMRWVTSRAQVEAARRSATRDPLTGLPNRGLFDETLTREVARQRRKALPLGLVVIDLDGFKRLNDTRGHGRGDEALRAVAEAIVGRVRESDLPARLGGDEFAVVLPDCSSDDAVAVGEALRRRIELAVGPQVTASVGVAVMPDHAADADGLLAAADAALYVAKHRGGNEAHMVPTSAMAVPIGA